MNLVFGAPQIIWAILFGIGLFAIIIVNGNEAQIKDNSSVIGSLLIIGMIIGILIWGGFFNYFQAPQLFWIIHVSFSFLGDVQTKIMSSNAGRYNLFSSLSFSSLNIGILYIGGFFTGGVMPTL